MTYQILYSRACKKGDIRTDEYTVDEFIYDVNDLARVLWTSIFQRVNGNKPSTTRVETFTVSGNTEYVHTRTLQRTPILKIVFEECTEIDQKTDEAKDFGHTSFEYDDEEVRFKNSDNGSYQVFYESGEYQPLTLALYNAGASPDWLKEDFHPIFWSYVAFMNTDTRKEEMQQLYLMHLEQFKKYYSRTETLENQILIADDSYDQL